MVQSIANIEAQQLLDTIPASLIPSDLSEDSDHPSKSLKTAFDLFNELSLKLADSYQHLEQRVVDLTSELDNVSEQRYQELQQKEQLASRLETLINVLPGGVIVLDKKGTIVESNPAAELLLESKLSGQYWRDVIGRCFAPRDDDGHEVSNRAGKRISIVTRSLDEDGQIILLTDQTETRQLQAELSRNERLSALGKMVSTLAHQVRTPLASAMLYANHIHKQDLPIEQRHDFTHKLLNRLHYMERQVRDMLLFVKGDIPITDKVSVSELQKTLAETVEMPIKAHSASCYWDIGMGEGVLQCNLDAVIGALLNLVNNSLQATHASEITIRFQQEEHFVAISILDNGPGIEENIQDKLQDLFFTTKDQGTGIGLSVVKVVAQSHGGSFALSNRTDGGACACLRLPLINY